MPQGRSKAVFEQWVAARSKEWSKRIEVVAIVGSGGIKTAAAEALPDAVAVMDPFHVVRLAGDALDVCRRRVQQDNFGRTGKKGASLYQARLTLHTGDKLLTEFSADEYVKIEATLGVYQRMITAYREPDKKLGKQQMQALIDAVSTGVPTELRTAHIRPDAEEARSRYRRILRPPRHQQILEPDELHREIAP